MAASAPRPAPESRGQKRQLELLNEDAKKLCATDIRTPFRSLQDAVDRLLPFHVSAAQQAAQAHAHLCCPACTHKCEHCRPDSHLPLRRRVCPQLLGGLESDAADLEELQEQPHPELIATRNQLAAQQVRTPCGFADDQLV